VWVVRKRSELRFIRRFRLLFLSLRAANLSAARPALLRWSNGTMTL
jgi:hypothetical protein